MKKYLYLATVVCVIVSATTIYTQRAKINRLTEDRNSYRTNTETLLQDVQHYQTCDSLSAAKVGVLELKLSEFEQYRASDAELIKTLRTKNRTLENVTALQTETITKLRGTVRDSLVYVDSVVTDTLKCIDINDRWFTLSGCITGKEFVGQFVSWDSLVIAATTEYKRFLGFLWKTKKIKSREVDVISKNPHTKIQGIEYVEIRK